jgi:hypothetical protein
MMVPTAKKETQPQKEHRQGLTASVVEFGTSREVA